MRDPPDVRPLAALVPVLFLFWALGIRRWGGLPAAGGALALALALAVTAFGMPPGLAVLAAGHGVAFALWPVAGILAGAVLLYELVVATGELDVVRAALGAVSADRRVQALVVTAGLGALLEGAAGFGTPVAIGGALLAALGFPPVLAATVALVGNTAAVGFGAIGIQMEVAGRLAGVPPAAVSAAAARLLPALALVTPFLVVALVAGPRRGLAAWPAALATGLAFAGTQALVSATLGAPLADVAAAVAGLAALLALLRVWRPAAPYRFAGDPPAPRAAPPAARRVLRAFTPFALLGVAVATWSLPPVRRLLDAATVAVPVPGLHGATFAGGPPVDAVLRLDLLAASGTAVVAALLLSVPALGATRADLALVLRRGLRALVRPVLTVAVVLAFAFLVKASGMAAALGAALAGAGRLFPAVSPAVGAVGVLLTGAVSSSNALFVPLQQVTAAAVGMSPLLAVAANAAGGVCVSMASPQALAVASAGVPGIAGREGEVLARTGWRAAVLLAATAGTTALLAGPLAALLPGRGAGEAPAAPPGSDGALLLGAAGAAALALVIVARRAGAREPHRDPGPPPGGPTPP